jgi:hypothetical protein
VFLGDKETGMCAPGCATVAEALISEEISISSIWSYEVESEEISKSEEIED